MEDILHHLGCVKPCKYWDKLHINWCRISSINRMSQIGSFPQVGIKIKKYFKPPASNGSPTRKRNIIRQKPHFEDHRAGSFLFIPSAPLAPFFLPIRNHQKKSTKVLLHSNARFKLSLCIYIWNPNDPCFSWKRPCLGGVDLQS